MDITAITDFLTALSDIFGGAGTLLGGLNFFS